MTEDTKLALLSKQVEHNADELARMFAAMRASELGDLDVLVSRESLVDALGDGAFVKAAHDNNIMNALRA